MKIVGKEKIKGKNSVKNKIKEPMRHRIFSLLMAMAMMVGVLAPLPTYAAGVSVDLKGGSVGQYQGIVTVTATVKNTTGTAIQVTDATLKKGNIPGGVTLKTQLPIFVENNRTESISWDIDVYGLPMVTKHEIQASVVTQSSGTIESNTASVYVTPIDDEDRGKPNLPTVEEKDNTYKPDDKVNYSPNVKLEVIAPSGGLNAGSVNNVELKITNTGNAPFNKVVASVASLGDKMSLRNSSTQRDLGSMGKLKEASATFPIYVENSHEGGNVSLGFSVSATDPTGKITEFTITEFVTVNGGTSLADRLEITNIKNPQQVAPDQNFNVTFSVKNNSGSNANNVKITVSPTAPVVNRTKNIFVVNLAAGEAKAFDVQMFVPAAAEGTAQNYPIEIKAETSGSDASSIAQYTGVFVNTQSDKTVPQIIITNYSYGGEPAVANEVFPLTLSMTNTNTKQALKNIRVSLTAEEGVFIPHNASSSFYIASIAAGGTAEKTIQMMTIPEAPEKTVAINVDINYEDEKGNPIAAKDIISVPVVQERRLVIDDIAPMESFFVGQQGNISVQFYNMGKNALNNLIISAEGDFDFPQSTKSFVGKMEAGKNDYYDLQFIPTKTGESEGKLIFSFEDSNGKEIIIEKTFKITADEMPPMEPIDEFPMEEPGMSRGAKMGIGAAVIGAIAGVIIYKRRKKKQRDMLDMDTEE